MGVGGWSSSLLGGTCFGNGLPSLWGPSVAPGHTTQEGQGWKRNVPVAESADTGTARMRGCRQTTCPGGSSARAATAKVSFPVGDPLGSHTCGVTYVRT